MKTLPHTEAKAKLSALIDGLRTDEEEIVITRNGVAAAVLVSPDEFERWRETVAIQLDSETMREIRAGLQALDEGRAALYTLDELFDAPANAVHENPA